MGYTAWVKEDSLKHHAKYSRSAGNQNLKTGADTNVSGEGGKQLMSVGQLANSNGGVDHQDAVQNPKQR